MLWYASWNDSWMIMLGWLVTDFGTCNKSFFGHMSFMPILDLWLNLRGMFIGYVTCSPAWLKDCVIRKDLKP